MVLGVYITYKLLDIADLTVDGSFALGGCVCAILVANKIVDPVTALFLSAMAGVLAGAVTGILHTLFEIPAILAGILTQIALWSVNLRVMGGKSNVPLLKENHDQRLRGHDGHEAVPGRADYRNYRCGGHHCDSLLVLWNGDRKRHARDGKQ